MNASNNVRDLSPSRRLTLSPSHPFISKGTVVFLGVNASYSHSSLALWILREIAEREGWKTRLIEMTVNDDVLAALARVSVTSPDVLAASAYLFNRPFLLSFLRRFKALHPNCVVIGGGPEFLGDSRHFLRCETAMDVVARGEGERVFPAFLQAAHQPGRWSKIPGLCGRLGRRVFDNGLAPTVQDLDDIPSPYARHLEGFDKPFILLETARGCSNRCSFCTSADSGPIRVFSTDRLRRELTLIQSHGIPEVRITDRTFNGKPSRCLELLRLFRDEFPGLRFHLEFDPARLTPSILGELAKTPAGQFHIEAGIQSLLPRAFRLIGRQATLRRTLAGVKALVQCVPLRIHTDLIAGLPGTTLKSLLADVRRLAAIGPGEIQVELLKLLPGTRLAAERDRLGLVAAPEPPYEILRGPAFPLEDANSARQLAFLTDWYYNAVPLQAVIRVASESLPSFWKKWLAFHRTKHRAFACPSLERRFALLFEFVSKRESAHSARLKQRIQYAWMKYGFSAQHGLCAAQPWTDPIPADAVLVEGDRQATASRVYRVSLDRDYLFVYGRKHEHQRAVAVYVLK